MLLSPSSKIRILYRAANSVGSCPCSNLHKAEKDWRFSRAGHTVAVMVTILCAVVSILEFRVRSRASLELELVALRHQVTVLRRRRPGRPQLSSLDRLLWVWLYRIWPQVIDAMLLVKPATVVRWPPRLAPFNETPQDGAESLDHGRRASASP